MLKIAISQRLISVGQHEELRDSLSLDWSQWLSDMGAATLPIPNLAHKVSNILEFWQPDLLVLSNGEDLPVNVKGELLPGEYGRRELTEITAWQWAIEHKVPVLGVCRGCQLLNCLYGGKLMTVEGHVAQNHSVLCEFPFYQGHRDVNSYHNSALKPELSKVKTLAITESEQIEAFIHEQHKVVGIMWHPEREYFSHQSNDDFHLKLINWMLTL